MPTHHDPHRRVGAVTRAASGGSRSHGAGTVRRLVIEADGGSRGNPGVAGYGALVREPSTGEVLVELAEPLGKVSNNVAEYSGLIAGLRAVLDIDAAASVVARLDSKLVVEQMAGRWKIKHEDMRRLALKARELCSEISAAGGSVDFEWIPREKNKAADALSNEAMDGNSVHRVPIGSGNAGEAQSGAPAEAPAEAPADDRPSVEPAAGDGSPTREALRLLLVQEPADPGDAPRVAQAVRRLVGGAGRLVSGAVAAETVSAVAEALELFVEHQDDWSAPGGQGADVRVRAAYEQLARRGGTVVVVTTRRGVLTVVGEVLGIPHDRFWALATAPGSLSGVEVWPDGTASVAFTNRTDHLG
ncbi:MAG: reverse transcriptase-like protein [Terracoccus sp.]